ncbi:MAG: S-methyl-5-thioribose-1-phosphate isomerase, partial [Spirochaetae bacterium HGW-Spirochaetae-6]
MINLKPVTGYPNKVVLIDQTLLPLEQKNLEITSLDTMCDAIKRLVVRGAPAIGIAAA